MEKNSLKRQKNGLITGVEYVFDEDGFVDWRKMVKVDYLVPNRDKTQETDVSKLEDNKLLILLNGIKELAQLRGFNSVRHEVSCPSSDYVISTCTIDWIPNFETENRAVSFSAIGDASPSNTKSFAKFFLGPIAENRAFVRCVRNFLKIAVVGQDELGGAKLNEEVESSANQLDPYYLLESVMKDKGLSLGTVIKQLEKEAFEKADQIKDIKDIPKNKAFELINRIKKSKKTK